MIDQGVAFGLGIQALIIAAAWGDLRRTVAKDREQHGDWRQAHEKLDAERHEENQHILRDISSDVKRINGTVQRHGVVLENHAGEIDRLRNK